MKRIIVFLMVSVLCLSLCACNNNDLSFAESTTNETTSLSGDKTPDKDVLYEEDKDLAQTSKVGTEPTESVTDEPETTAIPKETETEQKPVDTSVENVEKTESAKPSVENTESPSETKQPSVTETTDTTVSDETQPSENTSNNDSEVIVIVRPSAAEVSEKVVQYLNQFRSEQGAGCATVLPGLTQIAEYRSKQLVTNFAHDTLDEREALAHYQYGKYVDMTKHGFDESYNYYTYGGGEAIAKGNWGGTAEEIALKIATGFRNSNGHWSYVGGAEYNYMAVGCTYDPANSSWYCCVLVSIENYG